MPVQRRARIAAALGHASQRDPLPPLLQQDLTGRREHIATRADNPGVDLDIRHHSPEPYPEHPKARSVVYGTECPRVRLPEREWKVKP